MTEASVSRPTLVTTDDPLHTLRELGARAHQLRAATRAADHFSAQNNPADTDTGSWLMSCAVGLAKELAADVDALARALRSGPPEPSLRQHVARLRIRVHQMHAAARAADHFLDQDNREDNNTGSWLIACALGLADKLTAELDNGVPGPKPAHRAPLDLPLEPHDAALARRMKTAIRPLTANEAAE
jgi:hypothetical protein